MNNTPTSLCFAKKEITQFNLIALSVIAETVRRAAMNEHQAPRMCGLCLVQ